MGSISDVRVDVSARLYALLQRRAPGTKAYEIAEKALWLVLSDRREAVHAPFLHRSVLRDAGRIVRRARTRRPEDLVEQPSWLADTSGASPEDLARTRELAAQLRAAASAMHPAGGDCFDGLLARETIEDTSARTGVPGHEIKRIRARMREMARAAWPDATHPRMARLASRKNEENGDE